MENGPILKMDKLYLRKQIHVVGAARLIHHKIFWHILSENIDITRCLTRPPGTPKENSESLVNLIGVR